MAKGICQRRMPQGRVKRAANESKLAASGNGGRFFIAHEDSNGKKYRRYESKSNEQRTLKIETAGDMYYRKTFPKIRLQGKWLANVGFKPTERVAIMVRCQGELLLKFIEPD